jgi:hypothetical protein
MNLSFSRMVLIAFVVSFGHLAIGNDWSVEAESILMAITAVAMYAATMAVTWALSYRRRLDELSYIVYRDIARERRFYR